MIPRPPRSTRTHTLFPYTTLVRSHEHAHDLGIRQHRKRKIHNNGEGAPRPLAPVAWLLRRVGLGSRRNRLHLEVALHLVDRPLPHPFVIDRKSTRLNSSH